MNNKKRTRKTRKRRGENIVKQLVVYKSSVFMHAQEFTGIEKREKFARGKQKQTKKRGTVHLKHKVK